MDRTEDAAAPDPRTAPLQTLAIRLGWLAFPIGPVVFGIAGFVLARQLPAGRMAQRVTAVLIPFALQLIVSMAALWVALRARRTLAPHDPDPARARVRAAATAGLAGLLIGSVIFGALLYTESRAAYRDWEADMTGRSVPQLITAAGHARAEVRQAAVSALARRGEAAGIQTLIGALQDRDTQVAWAAAGGLAGLARRHPQVVTGVADLLRAGKAPGSLADLLVRVAATGNPDPVPLLLDIACAGNAETREACVTQLSIGHITPRFAANETAAFAAALQRRIVERPSAEQVHLLLIARESWFGLAKPRGLLAAIDGLGRDPHRRVRWMARAISWEWHERAPAAEDLSRLRASGLTDLAEAAGSTDLHLANFALQVATDLSVVAPEPAGLLSILAGGLKRPVLLPRQITVGGESYGWEPAKARAALEKIAAAHPQARELLDGLDRRTTR